MDDFMKLAMTDEEKAKAAYLDGDIVTAETLGKSIKLAEQAAYDRDEFEDELEEMGYEMANLEHRVESLSEQCELMYEALRESGAEIPEDVNPMEWK